MADRLANIVWFVATRLWVMLAAFVLIVGFRLAAKSFAPPPHPERVVVHLGPL
jgi:hypothetical protein